MPAVITRIKSLPPAFQLTAIRMEAVGFGEGVWHYAPNHDLADMSRTEQVRNIKGTVRKSRVDHYATILKPYTLLREQLTMPPVIFTADDVLLDGNTRTEAARKCGWKTYPALVISFKYHNAPPALAKQFLELAAVLNLTHGDNIDRASVEGVIARLADDDTSARDLAMRLGVSKTTVANVLYARTARQRAERLEVPFEAPHLSRTHLSDLGRENDKFTDEVYAALLNLIIKGKLTNGDQRVITRTIHSATTIAGKLDIIAAEMGSRQGITSGRASKPKPAGQLRQALGKVNGWDPGEIIETNPKFYTTHRQALRLAIENLGKALDQQRQFEEDQAFTESRA